MSLKWAQIEAAAQSGISWRAWRRLSGEGERGHEGWAATLADAYDRALADLEANASDEGDNSPPVAAIDQYAHAITLYRAMLENIREDGGGGSGLMAASARADINIWLGNALRIIGRADEAITAFQAAAKSCPACGDAYWSLANLKTYRFSDGEIAAMEQVLATDGADTDDLIQTCFALGKALEDRADYQSAWGYYSRGNDLRRLASAYRPEIAEINAAEQRRVCTRDFFEERKGWGNPASDPIFIVGLPRAGSTLIEQILASHSKVDGTRELAMIQRLVAELHGPNLEDDHPRYPEVLRRLTPEEFRRLGDRYLNVTSAHRRGRPFFIDKMPNNFRDIGLIALILPNARIIDARRSPLSCCLSNLKQYFPAGQEFSYGMADIGHYYRTYVGLMRHWDEVLPGKILRVCHEDLVDNFEHEVRRILDHCGLPFEAECLAFHKTGRNVHTPSSEQVRQPINRDGVNQWRHFEFALDPMKLALGETLTDWRR